MSYLLDIHALLWTLLDPARLGKKSADCIRNLDVTVFVSVVSLRLNQCHFDCDVEQEVIFGNFSCYRGA